MRRMRLVERSSMSSESGLEDPQELADEVPPFNSSVNVSEFLKSANRFNKSLNTTASRSEGNNSRLSNYRSKHQFDDNLENIDPNQLPTRLKQQLHESHKRQANQRLQLSRLKTCIDRITQQSQQLRQQLLQAEVKITKNNEYILKLDNQLRISREEVDRYRKQNQTNQHTQQDYSKLEEENKEMRFVIEELLKQLQEREGHQSHRNSLDKRQNIAELMKDLRTYPSSESSRGSSHKPASNNVFEFTMNPRSNQLVDQQLVLPEQPQEQYTQEVEQRQSLNQRIRMKVLSVIHEDMEDGGSRAPTDEYIRSRINELASLNQSISCGRSFMYASNDN